MLVLSKKEIRFLKSHELRRLATVSRQSIPHVTPVVYAIDGQNVTIAIDYGTKKFANLKENQNVSLVVDTHRPNAGLVVEGKCQMFERGAEYVRLLKILFDRFEFYRKNPWGEDESPILKVVPSKSASWGL